MDTAPFQHRSVEVFGKPRDALLPKQGAFRVTISRYDEYERLHQLCALSSPVLFNQTDEILYHTRSRTSVSFLPGPQGWPMVSAKHGEALFPLLSRQFRLREDMRFCLGTPEYGVHLSFIAGEEGRLRVMRHARSVEEEVWCSSGGSFSICMVVHTNAPGQVRFHNVISEHDYISPDTVLVFKRAEGFYIRPPVSTREHSPVRVWLVLRDISVPFCAPTARMYVAGVHMHLRWEDFGEFPFWARRCAYLGEPSEGDEAACEARLRERLRSEPKIGITSLHGEDAETAELLAEWSVSWHPVRERLRRMRASRGPGFWKLLATRMYIGVAYKLLLRAWSQGNDLAAAEAIADLPEAGRLWCEVEQLAAAGRARLDLIFRLSSGEKVHEVAPDSNAIRRVIGREDALFHGGARVEVADIPYQWFETLEGPLFPSCIDLEVLEMCEA